MNSNSIEIQSKICSVNINAFHCQNNYFHSKQLNIKYTLRVMLGSTASNKENKNTKARISDHK